MSSILLEPCNSDYPATAEIFSLTQSDMQEIASQSQLFEDSEFLSRLDTFEEHLNSDLTFEQYVRLMDELPCPCPTCIVDSGMTTVQYAILFLQKLQQSWSVLLNVVEPYVTPPHSPVGETFPYEPFPTSPTNQEMHAQNGNIVDMHDIQSRLKSNHAPTRNPEHERIDDLLHPAKIRAKHHNRWFDSSRSLVEDIVGARIPGYPYSTQERDLELNPLLEKHPDWKSNTELLPPAHEHKPSRLLKLKKITNQEQHAKNGNQSAWNWHHPDHKIDETETLWDHESKGENPATFIATGPSNREMHSYNGNINPVAAALQALEKNKRKSKQNKKLSKRRPNPYRKRTQSKPGKAKKSRPPQVSKNIKNAGRIESAEKRLASRYASFLKNPVFAPPRLGSTGNVPTNLIHGYYRATYTMAQANNLANATTVMVALSPVMFKQFVTVSDFVSPITIGFTTSNSVTPAAGGATGDYVMSPYQNDEAMKRQVIGSTNANYPHPLARFLGGSLTLECRCPMATTAPPFLYGGLLTQYPSSDTDMNSVDLSKQIISFTPDQIRTLPTSLDEPGFSVSSFYQPSSAATLEFNNLAARHVDANPRMLPAPIPYVGMVNCPTTAVITITASCWFEYQQVSYKVGSSLYNTADYSGWATGPKLSTEDVYDHLPKLRSVSTRIIGMGAKSSSSSNPLGALTAIEVPREITTRELVEEIRLLREQYQDLKVKIDEEEDEKYFDVEATSSLDKPDTPIYKGLSKSTLDLAMSIKKTLTPGSVTNKTVLNHSQ